MTWHDDANGAYARLDTIPVQLRGRARWVIWRREWDEREQKHKKPPYQARKPSKLASSRNPATWCSLPEAIAAVEAGHGHGIGYALQDDDKLVFTDLDNVIRNGALHETAAHIICTLDSYTEVSQSGASLHVLANGTLPEGSSHRKAQAPWGDDFEIYDQARFMYLTGAVYEDRTEVKPASPEVLQHILDLIWPPQPKRPAPPIGSPPVSDRELLEKAFSAKNGRDLQALYDGRSEFGDDRSRADWNLLLRLAFWTGPDPARLERLLRGSGLANHPKGPKWDRATGDKYVSDMVGKVLASTREYYDWNAARPAPTATTTTNSRPATYTGSAPTVAEPPEPASSHLARPVVPAATLTKRRVRWTWRGRLALGYLAVWCGAGEIGKSTFAAWVMRGLTRGELDGEFLGKPQRVLIVSTEDGREDMWLPRLEAIEADQELVGFLDYPDGWNIKDGVSWISRAVHGEEYALAYIDALMSHMPDVHGSENTRSPTYVRAALAPLARLCRDERITGLFGLHPRKAGGETFADVVQESGVFTQLPRIGLLFGYHPDDLELDLEERRRVIIRAKGNVGRNPGGLSFRIEGKDLDYGDDDPEGVADSVGFVADVRRCEITERELLAGRPTGSEPVGIPKVQVAEELIRAVLGDGEWHPSKPIYQQLEDLGIRSPSTIQKATSRAGVHKRKQGDPTGVWEWRLPGSFISRLESESSRARARDIHIGESVGSEKPPQNPTTTGRLSESLGLNEPESSVAEDSQTRSLPTRPLRARAREGGLEPRPDETYEEWERRIESERSSE